MVCYEYIISFALVPRAGGAKKGKQAASRSKAKASQCKIHVEEKACIVFECFS